MISNTLRRTTTIRPPGWCWQDRFRVYNPAAASVSAYEYYIQDVIYCLDRAYMIYIIAVGRILSVFADTVASYNNVTCTTSNDV